MDRRNFIKTVCATSFLTPLLLGSSSHPRDELFLISDTPENYLTSLLTKTGIKNRGIALKYFVLDVHPRQTAISEVLEASGWTEASLHQRADLTLSFRLLQHAAPPSFTLVRNGRILDIRTKNLFSIWKKMSENGLLSSCLTIASLPSRVQGNSAGRHVRILHGGREVKKMVLNKDQVQVFWAEQGKITVKIERGKASIPSSSCRHKICCSAPPVSIAGERIVCAPNHFLLDVQGPGSVDTIIG